MAYSVAYSGDEPGEQWLLRSEPAEAAAVMAYQSGADNRPDLKKQLQLDTTLLPSRLDDECEDEYKYKY